MRLQLQREDNRSETNRNNNGDSQRRNDHRQLITLEGVNSDLLKEMRREMDKLRSVIREKTDRSLDRMVRRTDSPFTIAVIECLMPLKFRLPQLESFDGLKDPLDHLNTFKTTLGLQQSLDEILCCSFPTTLKGAAQEWFTKLPTSSKEFQAIGKFLFMPFHRWTALEKASRPPTHHQARGEGNSEFICEMFHQRNL